MKFLSPLFISLFLLSIAGCKKQINESIIQDKITLHGVVLLYDEADNLVDRSGMTVAVENSNPTISCTTNSGGEFSLPIDAKLTSFTLVYSKSGYGTFKRNYEHSDSLFALGDFLERKYSFYIDSLNNADIVNETLGKKSTVTINSIQSVVYGTHLLKLRLNVSSPNWTTGDKYIRLFFQKNLPNICFANVPKTIYNYSMPMKVHPGSNDIDACLRCLEDCNEYKSGDTLYFTGYGEGFVDNIYTDKTTKIRTFPNVNLSSNLTPVSFVLP